MKEWIFRPFPWEFTYFPSSHLFLSLQRPGYFIPEQSPAMKISDGFSICIMIGRILWMLLLLRMIKNTPLKNCSWVLKYCSQEIKCLHQPRVWHQVLLILSAKLDFFHVTPADLDGKRLQFLKKCVFRRQALSKSRVFRYILMFSNPTRKFLSY